MRKEAFVRRWLPALLGLASFGLLAACGSGPRGDVPSPSATPAATRSTVQPSGVVPPGEGAGNDSPPLALPSAHVHAVARDPQDGGVLLAAHDGLYRYEGTAPRRTGPVIDLMAFTVAGPGHYYASGHPGTLVDLPQPVGLIESRDAGQSWVVISRGGQSDFHALAVSGRGIAGFDGELRVSADGRSWVPGSLAEQPLSMAGTPGGHVLLATTEQGLMRSSDGGHSWQWLDQAPWLQFVAFGDDTAAVGLSPDGQLYRSKDAGRNWEATDVVVPNAHALWASEAGKAAEVLVVTDRALLTSRGGGPFVPLTADGA